MNYEKLHNETLRNLQEMVSKGKITEKVAKGICSDFVPESEDERIRKDIISFVEQAIDAGYGIISKERKEKWIAWLEKQGRLMKALQISNARIGELIEKNYYLKEQFEKQRKNSMGISEATKKKLEDSLNKALEKETPESWNKFLEKQGEQKPVNVDYVSGIREELLSIEDSAENIVGLAESQWVAIRAAYRLLGEYIAKEQKLADKVEPKFKVGDCIRHKGADECYIIVTIDDNYYFCENNHAWSIRSQDCFELVEQKSYWGEEDERIYKVIVELLNSWSNGTIDGCIIPPNTDRYINWLKSLKDRVEPQPKQEWSEDDVNTLNSIINYLEEASGRIALPNLKENYIRQIDWLKSLRPQPHWKPSEEQLIDFERAINDFIPSSYKEIRLSIENLLEQLKKLKS